MPRPRNTGHDGLAHGILVDIANQLHVNRQPMGLEPNPHVQPAVSSVRTDMSFAPIAISWQASPILAATS